MNFTPAIRSVSADLPEHIRIELSGTMQSLLQAPLAPLFLQFLTCLGPFHAFLKLFTAMVVLELLVLSRPPLAASSIVGASDSPTVNLRGHRAVTHNKLQSFARALCSASPHNSTQDFRPTRLLFDVRGCGHTSSTCRGPVRAPFVFKKRSIHREPSVHFQHTGQHIRKHADRNKRRQVLSLSGAVYLLFCVCGEF